MGWINAGTVKLLWLLSVSVFLTAPVRAKDDKELRVLASQVYLRCISDEGDRVLSRAANTKPNEFEKIASILCKEHEGRLREVLHLDMLQAQLKSGKLLNQEAQRLVAETIEQVITNMRRGMVVLYASAFDKMHPGRRSCSLNPEPQIDDRLKYLCAVRD